MNRIRKWTLAVLFALVAPEGWAGETVLITPNYNDFQPTPNVAYSSGIAFAFATDGNGAYIAEEIVLKFNLGGTVTIFQGGLYEYDDGAIGSLLLTYFAFYEGRPEEVTLSFIPVEEYVLPPNTPYYFLVTDSGLAGSTVITSPMGDGYRQ